MSRRGTEMFRFAFLHFFTLRCRTIVPVCSSGRLSANSVVCLRVSIRKSVRLASNALSSQTSRQASQSAGHRSGIELQETLRKTATAGRGISSGKCEAVTINCVRTSGPLFLRVAERCGKPRAHWSNERMSASLNSRFWRRWAVSLSQGLRILRHRGRSSPRRRATAVHKKDKRNVWQRHRSDWFQSLNRRRQRTESRTSRCIPGR